MRVLLDMDRLDPMLIELATMSWLKRISPPLPPSFFIAAPLTQSREMGLMHITGHRDAPPAKVGVAVTDLTTGLYTSNSILASLLQRAITGKGQWIDISLSDCQVATLSNLASSHLISGKPDSGRWGTAHPSIVPYKGFSTSDGVIMLGGGNDRLFGVLCDKLDRKEWKQDPKFVTNAKRVENRELLEELITTITKQKATEEWLVVFEGSGMPYAAVNDIAGTMRHEHGEFSPSWIP
jgi:succinate--hydroxymethylglutarate CoA-transferase